MTNQTPGFVNFDRVKKSYDGRSLVVKSLSLRIAKGEFLTMLGPSGSGKTTSLMMLAGFERTTGGAITVAGKDLTDLPPHRRDIGMVFQNYALFPHMTVAENVAFPLQARRQTKSEIASKVGTALDRVRMSAFADRRPAQLSGGQQQRVALARALVFEPAIVLMDEPLGALDKQLREHMQLEIKHLHKELGLTVVYVTHDQDEALAMSDRVAVFNNGIVEQIGTAKAIYELPETAFVSSFVGENNQIRGVVEAATDGECLVRAGPVGLRCVAVGQVSTGDSVVVSLRPERVVLASHDDELTNSVQVLVEEIVYFGDHLRLLCRMADGTLLSVKRPNTANAGQLARGQTVQIGWNAADSRALNAREASAG